MRTATFPTFTGYWTPLTASTNVRSGAKPTPAMLDDVPIVLFRDTAGRVSALVDRCPHRSVKLSIGRVEGDTLQCAFHGWRFDGTGACRAIPLNTAPRLGAVAAQRVPCEERAGLIWLYTGSDEPTPPLELPEPLDEHGWFGSITERDWPVHWSRSIQTMLDVAHIPFVHPKSIGVAFGRALGKRPDATLAHELVPDANGGFHLTWRIGAQADGPGDGGWLTFNPPHGMSLGIPQKAAGRRSLLLIWCVPLTETTSRMIVVARRNFGRFSPIPLLYDLLTPVILGEDRRTMKTVWPSPVPAPGTEVSMPSDAPTIAFAQYYARTFLADHAAPDREHSESFA